MIYRTWADMENALGYHAFYKLPDPTLPYKRDWCRELDMFRSVFDEGDIGLFCVGTPNVPYAWHLYNGEELLQYSLLAKHLIYYVLYGENKMPDALRSKCQTFLTIYLKEFYLWRIRISSSAERGLG